MDLDKLPNASLTILISYIIFHTLYKNTEFVLLKLINILSKNNGNTIFREVENNEILLLGHD